MTETRTFSAAVDEIIERSRRVDRKADVISFVRATMQECQARKMFNKDWVEDTTVGTALPHIWQHPSNFRKLNAVSYVMANQRGEMVFPTEIDPGPMQREKQYFYYSGASYSVFVGVPVGVQINLGYFTYLHPLPYYELALRPATYSIDTNAWTYLDALTDEEKENARGLVSNWMLHDYFATIVEGGLAKLYKITDDPRASSTFALYKSYQSDMMSLEPGMTLARTQR